MEFCYIRVSTKDKQETLRQFRYAKNNNVKEENIFEEKLSGALTKRPQLDRLLSIVKEGDIIYSSDASRLTRSLKHLISIIELAKEKKLKLVLGDFEIDCRKDLSAFTQGQLLMLGLVNELTRIFLVESVKDGLITAKEQYGRIGGQPKLTKERIHNKNPDFAKYYIEYKENRITFKELCRLSLISRNTGYRYLEVLKG